MLSLCCLHFAFLVLCGSLVFCDTNAVAQDERPLATASAEQAALTTTSEAALNIDQSQQGKERAAENQKNTNKNKKEPRGAIVVAPIPLSSPAIGSGIVLVGGYIFPFRKADTVSPPSTIAAAVLITDNGSRGLALGGEFYLKQNTYHITTIYFRGNINYDFYGVGTESGDAGLKLPLKQTGQVLLGEFLYRLHWKFFLGPRLLSGNSTITLRPASETTPPPPPGIGIQTTLTGLGFRLNRDTRSNRFYPTEGTLFDFATTFFAHALGSKYSFQAYRSPSTTTEALEKNKYLPTISSHARPAGTRRFTASASTAPTISCEAMSRGSISTGT